MRENNATVLADWDEEIHAEIDPLTEAYSELGKAFYEYRFEEPTPELLLYFDKITTLLANKKQNQPASIPTGQKRSEHLEEMSLKPESEPLTPKPKKQETPAEKTVPPKRKFNLFSSKASDGNTIGLHEVSQNGFGSVSENSETVIIPNPSFHSETTSTSGPITNSGFGDGYINSLDDLPDLASMPALPTDLSSNDFPGTPQFCSVCGSRVSPTDIFCGNCGAKLSNQ